MTSRKDLITLIKSTLIPQVKHLAANYRGVMQLVSAGTLSAGEVEGIESDLRRLSLSPRLAQQLNHLLWAKTVLSLLQAKPFTVDIGEDVLDKMTSLHQCYKDELDLSISLEVYAARLLDGITSARSSKEVAKFMQQCNLIRNLDRSIEVESAIMLADVQLQHFLSQNLGEPSLEALERQLDTLLDLQKQLPRFECDHIKETSLNLALFYLEDPTVPHSEYPRVLGKLDALSSEDDAFNQRVAHLISQHGRVLPGIEPPPPEPDPRPPTHYIQGKHEIQFEQRPIYARDGNPQLYIFRANWRDARLAVKEYVSTSMDSFEQDFKNELDILERCSGRHHSFLRYYGWYRNIEGSEHQLGIAMELCRRTLMEELSEQKHQNRCYAENELRDHFRGLLEGLSVLHAMRIYHQDIKPHNIFVGFDDSLKLADFNISLTTQVNNEATNPHTNVQLIQGTDGYMAPEVQDAFNHGVRQANLNLAKADIYALGLTFLQMITLNSVKELNLERHQERLHSILNSLPAQWMHTLLQKMLCFSRHDRIEKVTDLLSLLSPGDPTRETARLF